jgi:hypothetical protein
VRDIPPKNITFVTTPWVVNPADPNTVVWNTPKTDEMWAAIAGDERYPPEPPDPTVIDGQPLTVTPESVSVRVLNGTGKGGVATSAAEELTRQGFNVIGIADAETQEFVSSVVRYDADGADAARTVAASLPGAARVKRSGLGTTVEVVVGEDWPSVVPVVVKRPRDDEGVRQATEDICRIPG